ncbi:MAG: carbohydrate ABC transporter permease [Hungatella sp.]|nr:carbohydrate ABC transporter permease [Hungatella sp.]
MGTKKKNNIVKGIIYVLLVILSIIFMLPIIWLFANSLKSHEQIFAFPPVFFSGTLHWENFKEAFTFNSLPFGRFLLNSTFITVISMFASVLSSALIAFGFSRIRWRGRDVIFYIVVITMIIPQEILITPQFMLYNKLGLLDTYIPLVLPWFFGRPFYIFIMRQAMMGIPRELDESAKIDGCSTLQLFWKIIIPQSKASLIAAAIYAMQDQWNSYLEPMVFINSLEKLPVSVGLSYFSSMYSTQWQLVSAAAIIVALPLLVLFVFCQKYFIQGVVVSGVKG